MAVNVLGLRVCDGLMVGYIRTQTFGTVWQNPVPGAKINLFFLYAIRFFWTVDL